MLAMWSCKLLYITAVGFEESAVSRLLLEIQQQKLVYLIRKFVIHSGIVI